MTLLDTAPSPTREANVLATERLLWVGPVTVLASISAVLLVRLLVIHIPGARADATPLGLIAPTIDTVILVSIAVLVFAGITASSDHPVRTFRRVAFAALLVSFVPLLVVGRGPMIGGLPTALALGAMHVAAYIPCVTLLPMLLTMKK
jgi:hypothetical protein